MSKNIVMISTGGTIASKRNPETGLLVAGLLTGEELRAMCDLPFDIELDVQSVFQVPSNAINFEKLVILKDRIESVFENPDVDGVVVTHGTDTLEETAYFLELTICDKRPVIVTGSQRAPGTRGSDAFVNLRQAILLAADEESYALGVSVLFNENIIPARYVVKKDAGNVDGFGTIGFGHLGIVDGDDVHIYQKPVKRETYSFEGRLPQVEMIKTAAGSSGMFVRHAADMGVKGLVIEAFGRGQVPPNMMDGIHYAREKGLAIILTTSTYTGHIKRVYDFIGSTYDLEQAGVILADDLDSKKARIKLAILQAKGVKDLQAYF